MQLRPNGGEENSAKVPTLILGVMISAIVCRITMEQAECSETSINNGNVQSAQDDACRAWRPLPAALHTSPGDSSLQQSTTEKVTAPEEAIALIGNNCTRRTQSALDTAIQISIVRSPHRPDFSRLAVRSHRRQLQSTAGAHRSRNT